MIYALIWKRVEKDWRKLLCEFANRGLGVNLGLDFLFVGKEKIAMFAPLWKLLIYL